MPTPDFHKKPFDEGTLTKLQIFELYAREWLPVFLSPERPPRSEIHLFDFFAGPGTDTAGELGSPLRLLRQPRSIGVMVRPSESRDGEPVSFTDRSEVHRLTHIRPPERITGQWWNGRWKIRDYFDVLDAAGDRYWIFRVAQTGRWFLHGIFE